MNATMTDGQNENKPLVENEDRCCTFPKREKYSCEGMFCCYLPIVVMHPASFFCNKAIKIEEPFAVYSEVKTGYDSYSDSDVYENKRDIKDMPSNLKWKANGYKAAGCAAGTVLFVPAVAAWGGGCVVDILDAALKLGQACRSCCNECSSNESPPSHSMR